MRLLFARHGESEANVLREFSNRGLKHGLTDRGRLQSEELAQRLYDTPLDGIFTSPLLRATQTAEILSEELGIAFEVTDALREYDCGFLEGRSDPAAWELYEIVVHEWLVNHNWSRRIQGGESFLDIRNRFVPFVEGLVADRGATGEPVVSTGEPVVSTGSIVLIGHGGLYRCMLPLILPNIDWGFALQHGLGNTDLVITETTEGGLVCRSWGSVSPD